LGCSTGAPASLQATSTPPTHTLLRPHPFPQQGRCTSGPPEAEAASVPKPDGGGWGVGGLGRGGQGCVVSRSQLRGAGSWQCAALKPLAAMLPNLSDPQQWPPAIGTQQCWCQSPTLIRHLHTHAHAPPTSGKQHHRRSASSARSTPTVATNPNPNPNIAGAAHPAPDPGGGPHGGSARRGARAHLACAAGGAAAARCVCVFACCACAHPHVCVCVCWSQPPAAASQPSAWLVAPAAPSLHISTTTTTISATTQP